MGLSKIKDKVKAKLTSDNAYTTEAPYSNNGAYSQNSMPLHGRSYPSDLNAYNTQPDNAPTYQTRSPNPGYPDYVPGNTRDACMGRGGTTSCTQPYQSSYPAYQSPYTYPTQNEAPAYTQYASNSYQTYRQGATTTRKSEESLTEQEKELENRIGVTDEEKQRSAEERRRIVREYMRYNRDNTTGGGF